MKTPLLHALARAGLLPTAYRAYEAVTALRTARGPGPENGLPLPPARLRVAVAGTAGPEWFLESGRLAAESIRAAAARHGVGLDAVGALLDFGCGCGRVLRHWRRLPGTAVCGSDSNAALVAWCRRHLPFAHVRRNELAPPLPYADGSFGLAYALSVVTHLPESLQRSWLAELARVLRPGALLVVSAHGERYRERLSASERARFDAGEVVVRFAHLAGTNLCTSFHPPASLAGLAGGAFELLEHAPEGARGNPHQDLYVLRRA